MITGHYGMSENSMAVITSVFGGSGQEFIVLRKEVKDFTLLDPYSLNSPPSLTREISSLELIDMLYFF